MRQAYPQALRMRLVYHGSQRGAKTRDLVFQQADVPPSGQGGDGKQRRMLRDHVELLAAVARVAAPGAALLFSTNHRRFALSERALPTWAPVETTRRTVPPDFGYSRPHRSWRFTAPGS